MSGGLRHHSDEATGPESCGWIKRHRKKYRYYLEQTGASALRGSYAPGLQKQSSMYLDSADVVRDVENILWLLKTHSPAKELEAAQKWSRSGNATVDRRKGGDGRKAG